jgi:hypothetical protein
MKYLVLIILLLFATVAYAQRGHYPRNNTSGEPTKRSLMNFLPPLQIQDDGTMNNVSIIANGIDENDIEVNPPLGVNNMTGSLNLLDGTILASTETEFGTQGTFGTITEDEMGGKWFFVTSGSTPIELPDISETGHSACFYAVTAVIITLNSQADDYITLNGVQLGGKNWSIDSAVGIGDFVCIISRENGSSDEWITLGQSGAWEDGGVN